ncbi:MAG: ribonuclease P protein component [Kiritimatiellae bacterium]|nr:ribonuclease P protein component [Kiritimatiellia bacterium]
MTMRLPGTKYKRVFDQGRPFRGRLFAAWVLRSPDAGRQAGVVVSKKSFHDAVDRNRAKRILRAAFREVAPELVPDADWIFAGRASLGGKRTADVAAEIRVVARKVGCWIGGSVAEKKTSL